MAVLAEAISVIVRRDAIERAYEGGWDAFVGDTPNATLCSDGEIARVGFMAPNDVQDFVELLVQRGLTFLDEEKAKDIAIVDQQAGPTVPCDWLEFGRLNFREGDAEVSACWLFEGPRAGAGVHLPDSSMRLATPPGWQFEGSLSEQFAFAPSGQEEEQLEFLRSEGEVDVFRERASGREVYIRRRR